MDHPDNLNWFELLLSRGMTASRDSSGEYSPELFTADFLTRPPTVTKGALDGWTRGVVS